VVTFSGVVFDELQGVAIATFSDAPRGSKLTERYASKEYLSESKREILESIRDLARRIEHP
jgi:hypothetical protein